MTNRYNFTEEQVMKMYDLYLSGLSCTKVAKQNGTTPSTICNYFKKYGLKVENRQNKVNIDLQMLLKEYQSGKSLEQISKEHHQNRHRLSKILKEQNVKVINRQNKLRFNENIFDNIDTEEKAYWLGFIFADGTISSHKPNKKKSYRFELTLCEKDVNHLYKFNKFMQHVNNNVKPKPVKYKDEIKMSYRWSVSNKHLWEVLNNYGCVPGKSLILQFPKNIFNSNLLKVAFIRGYFDGDGCISFSDKKHLKPCCSIVGTSNFLNEIKNSIFDNSHKLTKSHDENNITMVYSISGTKAMMLLYMLYYKSHIFLDRKYKLFLYFKDCRFKAKALKLLEGKIGEGWDANPELIADLKNLQQCNA